MYEKTHVIVIGNNNRWAKEAITGSDEAGAIKAARRNAERPGYYLAYRVTTETTVNGMGDLEYPNPDDLAEARPELIGKFGKPGK